jgi:FixJ family two-component response regulator
VRGDPAEDAAVRDYLERLTECQRRIVEMRMADFTNREIADELGIGLRTVERELSQIRKDYPDDEGS